MPRKAVQWPLKNRREKNEFGSWGRVGVRPPACARLFILSFRAMNLVQGICLEFGAVAPISLRLDGMSTHDYLVRDHGSEVQIEPFCWHERSGSPQAKSRPAVDPLSPTIRSEVQIEALRRRERSGSLLPKSRAVPWIEPFCWHERSGSPQAKSRPGVDPLSPTILFNHLQSLSGMPPSAV